MLHGMSHVYCVHVAFAGCTCVAFVLHLCCICAVFVLHLCCIRAAFVLHLCGICAASVLHLCGICAAFVRHLCCICVAFVRHLCCICVAFMPAGELGPSAVPTYTEPRQLEVTLPAMGRTVVPSASVAEPRSIVPRSPEPAKPVPLLDRWLPLFTWLDAMAAHGDCGLLATVL